ncbi:hypothetical protein COLO4_15954 [Corchorus olitorius]|uniref:F-box associated beta-propeller type 1 domain-containing protein n=1 Tax=Corchorus olitorius TaxID=93759 RepID=A0A1R3JKJ7_9ROSI|nr:hypothetical protein COLO4_15954 [Corchorus olitorius]
MGKNSPNSVVHLLDLGYPSQPTIMEFPSTVPSSLRRLYKGVYFFRCCTFRGLLMVGSDSADSYFSLCNSCTRQSWKIPNPPLPNSEYLKRYYAAALGYDFFVKTHKVVIIRESYCAVYNVKTNSWSNFEVKNDDDLSLACWRYSLTLGNGAPHWIKVDFRRCRYQITYFDFSKNELMRIPKPNDADDYKSQFLHLFEMEGRLCVGYFPSHNDKFKVEIWVMMEHGVGESWTRLALSCDEIPPINYHHPISFAKDGMVSLVAEEENSNSVAIYIGKKRRIEIKTSTNFLATMLASPYVESLVSI